MDEFQQEQSFDFSHIFLQVQDEDELITLEKYLDLLSQVFIEYPTQYIDQEIQKELFTKIAEQNNGEGIYLDGFRFVLLELIFGQSKQKISLTSSSYDESFQDQELDTSQQNLQFEQKQEERSDQKKRARTGYIEEDYGEEGTEDLKQQRNDFQYVDISFPLDVLNSENLNQFIEIMSNLCELESIKIDDFQTICGKCDMMDVYNSISSQFKRENEQLDQFTINFLEKTLLNFEDQYKAVQNEKQGLNIADQLYEYDLRSSSIINDQDAFQDIDGLTTNIKLLLQQGLQESTGMERFQEIFNKLMKQTDNFDSLVQKIEKMVSKKSDQAVEMKFNQKQLVKQIEGYIKLEQEKNSQYEFVKQENLKFQELVVKLNQNIDKLERDLQQKNNYNQVVELEVQLNQIMNENKFQKQIIHSKDKEIKQIKLDNKDLQKEVQYLESKMDNKQQQLEEQSEKYQAEIFLKDAELHNSGEKINQKQQQEIENQQRLNKTDREQIEKILVEKEKLAAHIYERNQFIEQMKYDQEQQLEEKLIQIGNLQTNTKQLIEEKLALQMKIRRLKALMEEENAKFRKLHGKLLFSNIDDDLMLNTDEGVKENMQGVYSSNEVNANDTTKNNSNMETEEQITSPSQQFQQQQQGEVMQRFSYYGFMQRESVLSQKFDNYQDLDDQIRPSVVQQQLVPINESDQNQNDDNQEQINGQQSQNLNNFNGSMEVIEVDDFGRSQLTTPQKEQNEQSSQKLQDILENFKKQSVLLVSDGKDLNRQSVILNEGSSQKPTQDHFRKSEMPGMGNGNNKEDVKNICNEIKQKAEQEKKLKEEQENNTQKNNQQEQQKKDQNKASQESNTSLKKEEKLGKSGLKKGVYNAKKNLNMDKNTLKKLKSKVKQNQYLDKKDFYNLKNNYAFLRYAQNNSIDKKVVFSDKGFTHKFDPKTKQFSKQESLIFCNQNTFMTLDPVNFTQIGTTFFIAQIKKVILSEASQTSLVIEIKQKPTEKGKKYNLLQISLDTFRRQDLVSYLANLYKSNLHKTLDLEYGVHCETDFLENRNPEIVLPKNETQFIKQQNLLVTLQIFNTIKMKAVFQYHSIFDNMTKRKSSKFSFFNSSSKDKKDDQDWQTVMMILTNIGILLFSGTDFRYTKVIPITSQTTIKAIPNPFKNQLYTFYVTQMSEKQVKDNTMVYYDPDLDENIDNKKKQSQAMAKQQKALDLMWEDMYVDVFKAYSQENTDEWVKALTTLRDDKFMKESEQFNQELKIISSVESVLKDL